MAAGATATPQEPDTADTITPPDEVTFPTDDTIADALVAEAEDELAAAGITVADDAAQDTRPSVSLPTYLTSPDRFDLAALPPAPIQPGSPQSPYRRCSCIGVMPGRACTRCNNTRWLKVCKDCAGAGIKPAPNRLGSMPRRDRCGFCMGVGSTAATMQEIRDAQTAWDEYEAAGGKPVHAFADADGRIARGAKLPTPPPPPKRRAARKPAATSPATKK